MKEFLQALVLKTYLMTGYVLIVGQLKMHLYFLLNKF